MLVSMTMLTNDSCKGKSSFPGGILLGRDFLIRNHVSINIKGNSNRYVELAGQRFNFKQIKTVESICSISRKISQSDRHLSIARAKERTYVESNNTVYTRLKVPQILEGREVLLSSISKNLNLVIPRVLGTVEEGSVPVMLFNFSDGNVIFSV